MWRVLKDLIEAHWESYGRLGEPMTWVRSIVLGTVFLVIANLVVRLLV